MVRGAQGKNEKVKVIMDLWISVSLAVMAVDTVVPDLMPMQRFRATCRGRPTPAPPTNGATANNSIRSTAGLGRPLLLCAQQCALKSDTSTTGILCSAARPSGSEVGTRPLGHSTLRAKIKDDLIVAITRQLLRVALAGDYWSYARDDDQDTLFYLVRAIIVC